MVIIRGEVLYTSYVSLYECPKCGKRIHSGNINKLTENQKQTIKDWKREILK